MAFTRASDPVEHAREINGDRVIVTTSPTPAAEEPAPSTAPARSTPPERAEASGGGQAAWTLTDPNEFKLKFDPDPEVDYAWVVSYAQQMHQGMLAVYRRLDDKAAAIANYLGAGAGLLTLSSAAAAAGSVNRWVVLAALPSVACALVALLWAMRARKPATTVHPPAVNCAVGYAEYYREKAEAAFLGQWHLSIEKMTDSIRSKGRLVSLAVSWFSASVVCLLIPLAVAIVQKFA